MNKQILRKFHTDVKGVRTRKPITYAEESVRVYSTIPFISFEKACKMINQWGYNLEEVLAYKDKQGRLHQTNFNQHQALYLKKLELAAKEIKYIKQQVVTSFKQKTSQLYFVTTHNEEQIKKDPIHYEIMNLFQSNQNLQEFAY